MAMQDPMEMIGTLVTPWRWLTSPVFRGLERVPEGRPLLFVGNHTMLGMFDVPLMLAGLWEHKRIRLHSLGDTLHFRIPGWRDMLEAFCVIEGSRDNCRAAMREGKSLLVFPGGGREVFKSRKDRYKLLWGTRSGFARLAIESGYTIVPFASVGADECWDILLDADDIRKTPLHGLIERFHPRPDVIPPIVRGVGLSPLPRPERFYFHFGEPIETDTERLRGRHDDETACFMLREEVRWAVEDGLVSLLKEREIDPERHLTARIRHRLRDLLTSSEPDLKKAA